MKKNLFKELLFILFLLAADQLSKYLIAQYFSLNESIVLIPRFFALTYVQNTGAGFSILQGQLNFFYLITILALIFLCYLLYRRESTTKFYLLSLLLMLGGTIGNFIDRLTKHYVIDFLDFIILGYDFPVFNLADSFLTLGVFLFIIYTLHSEYLERKGRA